MKDPQKLGECYLKLVEMRAELIEIMERNPDVESVHYTLESALHVLDVVAHGIHRAAYILKDEDKNER